MLANFRYAIRKLPNESQLCAFTLVMCSSFEIVQVGGGMCVACPTGDQAPAAGFAVRLFAHHPGAAGSDGGRRVSTRVCCPGVLQAQ